MQAPPFEREDMRKVSGNSLVEVLIALCVLGIIVPASLSALGDALVAELKIQENAGLVSSAEWWFSRLTYPARRADLDAAPRVDEYGKARFAWDIKDLENGAVQVTLRVYGRFQGSRFTVSRIY